jgi:hypothetical protein
MKRLNIVKKNILFSFTQLITFTKLTICVFNLPKAIRRKRKPRFSRIGNAFDVLNAGKIR